jgi:diguanylate cyclase (GGDEF)-like protein
MFIDLDRFKGINDGHGHQVGDLVLKEVAQRLVRCVRTVDTVSRQGGDEFVVLLAESAASTRPRTWRPRVMQSVAQPIEAEGQSLSRCRCRSASPCSPATATMSKPCSSNADVAMYHAKQNGRNAFQFFSPEMNAHVIERVQMENSLRHASPTRNSCSNTSPRSTSTAA